MPRWGIIFMKLCFSATSQNSCAYYQHKPKQKGDYEKTANFTFDRRRIGFTADKRVWRGGHHQLAAYARNASKKGISLPGKLAPKRPDNYTTDSWRLVGQSQ